MKNNKNGSWEYSLETKLKAVEMYLNSEKTYEEIAEELGVTGLSSIYNWVERYKTRGKEGLMRRARNKGYDYELKLKVVQECLKGKKTYKEIAEELGINSLSSIYGWIDIYKKRGEEGLKDKVGYQNYTTEFKLKAVKECLKGERNYNQIAKGLGTNYTTLKGWVERYLDQGEEGLKSKERDKRYDFDLKLNSVKMYLEDGKSYKEIIEENKIMSQNTLRNWVEKYKEHGEEGLKPTERYKKYSRDLKLKAIKMCLEDNKGYEEVAKELKISSARLVANWTNGYRQYGEKSLDQKTKGEPYDPELRLKAVKMCLDGKGTYKAVGKAIGIDNASTISRWVRAYKDKGVEGLKTKRGKTGVIKKQKKLREEYPLETKIKAVNMYLEGNITQRQVADNLNIKGDTTVSRWVKAYEKEGIDGLKSSRKFRKYTPEFKLKAVRMCVDKNKSYQEVADELGVLRSETIAGWVKAYKKNGKKSLQKSKKRKIYKPELKLKAVKMSIEEEKKYQDIAKELGVSNSNTICRWVKDYNEKGIQGLNPKYDYPNIDPIK